MGLTIVTPPCMEPVLLDEQKAHSRVDFADDDALLRSYILAARVYCENYLERALITTTFRLTLDAFPLYGSSLLPFPFVQAVQQNTGYPTGAGMYMTVPSQGVLAPPDYRRMTYPNWGNIPLVKPPLQSVTSITYVDQNGDTQTWGAENYQVITSNEPGYIIPSNGGAYPRTKAAISEAVAITYVAGYGLNDAVPESVKVAIKLLAGGWYYSREPDTVKAGIEQAVHALLDQYRFSGVA